MAPLRRQHSRAAKTMSPPPPVRVVRFYMDGAFGVGKTSTLFKLREAASGMQVLHVCEPMRYWRCLFVDVVEEVYDTAAKRRSGEMNDRHATAIITTAQLQFANPYVVLHDRCTGLFGPLSGTRGEPDLLVIFDRHPSAACLCFPAARYILQDISVEVLITLAANLPRESPGGNILVACLDDEEEHLRRLTARARPGEKLDENMLRALRVVYCMLINTIDFANTQTRRRKSESDWERDWDKLPWFDEGRRAELLEIGSSMERPEVPCLEKTLLVLFKVPQLCDATGKLLRVYAWGLGTMLSKLRGLRIEKLQMDGKTPDECAADVLCAVSNMLATRASFTDRYELEEAVFTFNDECS
ncbi:thymidine kinase [Falconid herpesvirus 1]|uniref:Thymidine kinase n=2 Tax=Columbid alphaherpesvirus 1 TaxID=93386 RepID=A0A068ER26_9ALPH|nr:thymidine kinase [Falconid herpesvirus 1]YP_009352931.1 thymidine kinase [Columbid alphaherpesvirus 1]AID52727.1 thymidine kinase [Falconid herpesvirus 1]ARD71348.1 thymidine kinase [Columbid alphaherpesvirus 1]